MAGFSSLFFILSGIYSVKSFEQYWNEMMTGNPEAVELFHRIFNASPIEREALKTKLKASEMKKLVKYLDNTPEKREKLAKKMGTPKLSHLFPTLFKTTKLRSNLKDLTGRKFSLKKKIIKKKPKQ